MPKQIQKTPTSSFHLILICDSKFGNFVTKLSKKIIGTHKSTFILDGKEYRPHITLYLFSAPVRNIKKIIEKAKELSQEIVSTNINVEDLTLSTEGWVTLNVDLKNNLYNYHKRSIYLINPLREGALREKYRDKKYFEKLEPKEKEVLLKYGDKHSMKYFHPHLSLAHFKNYNQARMIFDEYKNVMLPKTTWIESIELVRTVGNETGGVGKILFKKNFV